MALSQAPVSARSRAGEIFGAERWLTTAVRHEMRIVHLLLNNGQLGKISKEQRAGQWDVWQTKLHNPDFSQWATLCGALGIRVTSAVDLDDALTRALAHDGPSLVEVMTDPELI